MKETPQEYVARMLRNIEGKEPLTVQAATAKKLQHLIKNQPRLVKKLVQRKNLAFDADS